jgi:hypothetical protein
MTPAYRNQVELLIHWGGVRLASSGFLRVSSCSAISPPVSYNSLKR